MSEGTSGKPNWRRVWIASAVCAALLTIAIFRDETATTRWQQYPAVWAMFWAMLTLTGVVMIFRMTFSPGDEFAERQRLREDVSANSPVALATERMLRWISKLRRGG